MKSNSVFVYLVCVFTFALASHASDIKAPVYKLAGKGCVVFVDCRPEGTSSDFLESVTVVHKTLGIVVTNSVGHTFRLANAEEQLHKSRGSVAVFIVDDPALPMTLTATESRWSLVNVAPLKADKPDKAKFARRLSILAVRQAYRVLGSDEAKGEDTCFHAILSLPDLDAVTSFDLTMGVELAVNEVMGLRGIEVPLYGTYEDACELGLAPKPTNDIQRAIWEKVHAPPKTPLKIKFDPASQKGKVTK